jgi:flavin-dependent dehydrogenase
VAPWSRFVEVYWSGRTQAYVTPVGPGEVGVAFISADPAVRPDACLDLFPLLRARLEGAEIIGKAQGATSVMLRIPRVVQGNVALIGEASGSVDAITGEGLSLLFREAIALGSALRAGDLCSYKRQHVRILRRARVMSRLLLSLSEFPRWRGRVFRAFDAEPLAFQNLLSLHVGERLRLFGDGGCSRLCRQLLLSH